MALGVLLRISLYKEKWAIVAPTEDKARIIMDYIIDHIFDDHMFLEQLDYNGTKEKLKQEKSKLRITFREGGEVRIYTGNAANTKATQSALMGFGAPNIILDESALIPDTLYATVKRMLGGSKDNFLLEIGNPFFDNHFKRTWYDPRYVHIFVDVYTALEEGRYTQDFIDEMRSEAYFDVLYECLFPASVDVLPNGYRRLMTDENVDAALIDALPELRYKKNERGEVLKNKWGFDIIDDDAILGIDASGTGNNETKFVVRLPRHGVSFVANTMTTEDLDEVADGAIDIAHKWNIGDYRILPDAGGVGHGLAPLLRARGIIAKPILFGQAPPDNTFVNMRAWMYWMARKWLKHEGGKLLQDDGWQELKLIYYKRNTTDKTHIEPKDAMIERNLKDGKTVSSPDTADAFVLTFIDTSAIVDEGDIDIDGESQDTDMDDDDVYVD